MKLILAASGMLLVSVSASAHHSRAEFSDDVVEIEGVLTNVIWRNPHVALFLDVESENGEEEAWRIETFGGPRSFQVAGVSRELFQIGERVIVAGQVSTRREAYFLGNNVLLPSGVEVVMGAKLQPRWDGRYVGGPTEFSGVNPQVVDAAAESLGIFRVWSTPDAGVGRIQHFPYTEEAVAARAKWDPVDNPIARCEQPGMPMTMLQPLPFQFIEDGQDIILHSPYFDTIRTIHINDSLNAESQPASHLGFSVGHWEENTLVVETRRVNYPYFIQGGTPQSDSVKITERFALSDDQTQLNFHMTVIDPLTFTEPATHSWHYLALGEPFLIYECNVF